MFWEHDFFSADFFNADFFYGTAVSTIGTGLTPLRRTRSRGLVAAIRRGAR